MSWHQHHCWSVTCDVCGDGWADGSGQPHFDAKAELEAHATRAGWVVTPMRAICPWCTPAEACAAAGHDWGRWRYLGPFFRKDGTVWKGRFRTCKDCSAVEWDPPAG